jgi:hypothetical protein
MDIVTFPIIEVFCTAFGDQFPVFVCVYVADWFYLSNLHTHTDTHRSIFLQAFLKGFYY